MADATEAAVYVDAGGGGAAARRGLQDRRDVEDHGTWEARKAEIAATTEAETLASKFAKEGLSKSGVGTRASGSCRRRATP